MHAYVKVLDNFERHVTASLLRPFISANLLIFKIKKGECDGY